VTNVIFLYYCDPKKAICTAARRAKKSDLRCGSASQKNAICAAARRAKKCDLRCGSAIFFFTCLRNEKINTGNWSHNFGDFSYFSSEIETKSISLHRKERAEDNFHVLGFIQLPALPKGTTNPLLMKQKTITTSFGRIDYVLANYSSLFHQT